WSERVRALPGRGGLPPLPGVLTGRRGLRLQLQRVVATPPVAGRAGPRARAAGRQLEELAAARRHLPRVRRDPAPLPLRPPPGATRERRPRRASAEHRRAPCSLSGDAGADRSGRAAGGRTVRTSRPAHART